MAETPSRDEPAADPAIRFTEQHADARFYLNLWGHSTHFPVKFYPELVEEMGQIDLLQLADALDSLRLGFRLRKRRQKHPDQKSNDCNDDQEFNLRKGAPSLLLQGAIHTED